MHLQISHNTLFRYNGPMLGEYAMEVRLQPLDISGVQRLTQFSIATEPATVVSSYRQPDQMGTQHHFILRNSPHDSLLVRVASRVDTRLVNPFAIIKFDAGDRTLVDKAPFQERYAEWLEPSPLVPLDPIWPRDYPHLGVFETVQALMDDIHKEFQYVPGATDVSTPLAEFVKQGRGVCQDYAQLMLNAGRRLGFPCRYVSGYVWAGGEDGTLGGGAMHAWTEFYLPHADCWLGFDPTNNILVGDKHVKVAVGRDYGDVSPNKGIFRAVPGRALPKLLEMVVDVSVNDIGQRSALHA